METEKPEPRLNNVELVPDATERLEGAIKHAARKRIPKDAPVKRATPNKPKARRSNRRP